MVINSFSRLEALNSTVILLLFAGFFVAACDDEETVVVPDNWITVSTDPMTIGYEGGSLTCDYTLAKGLDASVVYIINHESWCLGYIKDSKIMIDVDLSENIMMDAVKKRGADRQQLHEKIREHSMAASRVVKVEGGENDLLERIAADEAFGVTLEELEKILKPENYTGRAKEQTEDFLNECIKPVLEKYADVESDKPEINV